MSHVQLSTRPITLWEPPHRRLIAATLALAERGLDAWGEWKQQRAAVRQAAAQHAALTGLDARTLRDLGLGDWAAERDEIRSRSLLHESEFRGR